ncbi:pilus assembly protein PilM [Paenibacillus ferrarius]|uniref:pilus assembly protein PilM n=1 Tax=Paenibacillus ferrarius TaxID=1469647 RepID=UPI003D29E4BB
MMLGFGKKRIGITIDPTGVRYVSVKKKKQCEIGKSGSMPIAPGIIIEDQIMNADMLGLQVKEWVKAEKLRGWAATIAIPTSQIIIRKIKIPSIKATELRQLVDLEVETALHLPFEDPIYDFVKVGQDQESTQVLVFAAPKKLIASYVSLFEAAGVHVKAAEISASALTRAIASMQEASFEETMLISLEPGSLEVYMLQKGNPIFMRTITLMEYANNQEEKLSADQIGEIIAEISRMLSFYQYSIQEGNSRISQILVTGANESRVQLVLELQQALTEISVEAINFDLLTTSKVKDFEANAFRTSIGVAMLQKGQAFINLLPHRQTETKVKAFVFMLFAIAWLACTVLSGTTYWTNKKEIASNSTKIAQLNTQRAAAEAKLTKKPDAVSDPASFIAATKASRKDVVATVNSLMKPLPPDAHVSTLAFASDSQITLSVLFARMEDSARYLFDLRKLNLGESVQLLSISETSGGANTAGGSASDAAGTSANTQGTKQYMANYSVIFKKEAAKETAKTATDAKGATTNGEIK